MVRTRDVLELGLRILGNCDIVEQGCPVLYSLIFRNINAADCRVIKVPETDRQTEKNERQQVFHFSSYFRTTYRIH